MMARMATDFDAYLAAVLDEPAEVAQTVFARHPGSLIRGLRRRFGADPIARGLRATNLLTVTAERVLLFPQHLAYGSGLTLEPALLDWPRSAVAATGARRCHTWTGDANAMEGQGSDYVLLDLRHGRERVQLELPSKGHQKLVRALGLRLTGTW